MCFSNDADDTGRLPAMRGSGSPCNALNGADTRVMAFTLDPWRKPYIAVRADHDPPPFYRIRRDEP